VDFLAIHPQARAHTCCSRWRPKLGRSIPTLQLGLSVRME
jgi:hypothetical protein